MIQQAALGSARAICNRWRGDRRCGTRAFGGLKVGVLGDSPRRVDGREQGYPHPRVFCAKSAESLENKRVESFQSAEKCKGVRKSMKRQGISDGGQRIGSRGFEEGGGTHRRGEKSAEAIDKERVVRRPWQKRACNPLKSKELNVSKVEMERAKGENAGVGEWQTRGTVA